MRPSSLSVSSSSSTSSRDDFSPNASPRKSLLAPINSPTLPSHVPFRDRPRKDRTFHSKLGPSSSCRRVSIYVVAACAIFLGLVLFSNHRSSLKESAYNLHDAAHLPNEPAALIVEDSRGKKSWTVWIPPTSHFPLHPWQYAEICAQIDDVQYEMSSGIFGSRRQKGYYGKDPNYVDVQEAIQQGLLPSHDESPGAELNRGNELIHGSSIKGEPVCQKSLTYVMETDEAGMGNTLMRLWLAYGLARKERRAFFIDDTDWFVPFYRALLEIQLTVRS